MAVRARTKEPGSFSGRGRWLARLNTAAAVFLAVYIVGVLNLITFRHPLRFDLTEEGLHSLSGETLAKLKLVREEIRVIVPYHQQPRNPRHRAHVRVLDRALRLLKEYNAVQPLIHLVARVDIYAEPDRWESITREYDLSATEYNRIIFVAGEGHSFRHSVTPEDLASFEPGPDPTAPPRIKEFRGELAMTSAIMKLIHRSRKKVYFTSGHGELALHPALRGDLESSGFESKEMSFKRFRRIPKDCSLLVVAGPQQRFSRSELDILEKYLFDDGRMLVTLSSSRTGIEEVLEKWGTEVQGGGVGMRIVVPGQRLERSWVSAGKFNAAHPVTNPFERASHFDMRLWLPRPLKVTGGQRVMRTENLLETAPSENEIFFLRGGEIGDSGSGARDGVFVLATATMPEIPRRPPPDWKRRKTRIVVVGASNFIRGADTDSIVRDGYGAASHRDFFMNSVYWLVGEESLMSLGGRESLKRQLQRFDRGMYWFLFSSSVLIFPGVFALIGMGVYFLRRT